MRLESLHADPIMELDWGKTARTAALTAALGVGALGAAKHFSHKPSPSQTSSRPSQKQPIEQPQQQSQQQSQQQPSEHPQRQSQSQLEQPPQNQLLPDVAITRKWNRIILHHSAGTSGSAEAFDRQHRQQGWDGLGYHFVIGNGRGMGDGELAVGHRWTAQKGGAHCKGHNHDSIGICLVGNFENAPPTPRQLETLRKLVAEIHGVLPDLPVMKHGDLGRTLCPGKHLVWP